ncbi:hypothetical protein OS965_38360 [Streptomyces sp. H27-G5]|uniref:transposase family protein n=1 Tax=Streptomyces sp. H27-G5 TaxID=2996698 RepID=UPI002271CE28|nr:transposase family protein [Streptomyces sp. H27-G5]MCY0923931.1 hypothetical protein [Streptomyces sp. H27-G5]
MSSSRPCTADPGRPPPPEPSPLPADRRPPTPPTRGTYPVTSGKHRDTGFNLQIAATLAGDLLAVSTPVPGSRHDMHAWRQSGFPDAFADREGVGDLGYVGSGMITPRRKPPGRERSIGDKEANRSVNTLRAAVERAIAHLKDWKIFATRYRGPLTHFPLVAKTVTALAFYKKGW